MKIEMDIPLLDEILNEWEEQIGKDFVGYKNHVIRMLNICFYLKPDATDVERKKLTVAAAFHDIGIWSSRTIDYLPPSILVAKAYLEKNDLASWEEEISLIIDLHHKLRQVKNDEYPLIEIFRRADLVDFSLGTIKCDVPKSYIKALKSAIPNAGFHKRLVQLSWQQLKKNPLNPAPMMKW